jgi:Zn finger protein HypA/HybF involved in hydrogenase expression
MADPVPTGSDVSAGTYRCTNCGEELTMQSKQSLPPCPKCNGTSFDTIRGGDSVQDPYPGNG